MSENATHRASLKPLQEYFVSAKKDFLTPYLLGLTFLPYFFAFIVFGAVLYAFGGEIFDVLYTFLHIDFGFSSVFFAWIQNVFDAILRVSIFVFLFFAYFALSLLLSLLICAFVAPYVVRFVRNRHYPQCTLDGGGGIFASLLYLLGIYLLYLVSLVLLIPLYFVPFVGGVLMLFPGFWLYRQTMLLDVGGEIFKRDVLKNVKKQQKSRIFRVVLMLFGLSLIPIVGFFTTVYALSVLSHLCFDIKDKGL